MSTGPDPDYWAGLTPTTHTLTGTFYPEVAAEMMARYVDDLVGLRVTASGIGGSTGESVGKVAAARLESEGEWLGPLILDIELDDGRTMEVRL